jgi:uncharacterized membrane protein SpoIIM required for sporulation
MDPLSTAHFQRQREDDWKELEQLCAKFEKRRWRGMPTNELEHFGALYRRTATHLAQVRSRPKERRLEASLNQLLMRAHGHLYRPVGDRIGARIGHFFLRGFPATVRLHPRPILLSAGLLMLGLFMGWLGVNQNPDLYYAVVPIQEMRSPGASAAELQATLVEGRDGSTGELTFFSGFLWQHNVRVTLIAFALGALAGIPTLLLIFFNGLMIGAMTSVFHQAGLATSWWAWIVGHGVTEMTAIVFGGAAGFILGEAVLRPGDQSRSQALANAARPALQLVSGTILMLLIAALLEGFFRQSEASNATRFAVAGATAVMWILYFYLPSWLGRLRQR